MITQGWDTISIISQEKINEEIKSNWSHIDSHFCMRPSSAIQIQGIFSSFRIISGGGGKLLRMELPIQEGTCIVNGESISLNQISAVIDITLSMLPQGESLMQLQTEYKKYVKNAEEIKTDETGWIVPIKLIDPEGKMGIYGSVLMDQICKYFISNPQQFIIIFASVNFAQEACPKWALPKKCAYAYLDSGYLAVLAVTTNKDIGTLPLNIDVSGMTQGTGSFYILSDEMLLRNLVLPGLKSLYQTNTDNAFDYKNRQMSNNRALAMKEIKSGAIYYTPVVRAGGNQIYVPGDFIEVSYDGTCDLYAGITMYWKGSQKLRISLKEGRTISFSSEDVRFFHDEDIPWYLQWLILVVGLIVDIVVSFISEDLIDSIQNRIKSVNVEAIDTVTWFGEKNKIKNVQLKESLIFENE